MADVTIAVQQATREGLTAAYTGSLKIADTHFVNNDGKTLLHLKNGTGEATITIATPQTVDGLAVADRAVTVPANAERFVGPFPPGIYNDAGHNLSFNVTGVTGLEVAALRV